MDTVNMVNALAIAKERNIDVRETRDERPGDYHTQIKLTVSANGKTRSVAGTLFADRRPRIVQVKGIKLEAELGRHMLYVTNRDVPGFIGALGTVLGEAKVNIATFHLGRAEAGGDAIALIEVDDRPDIYTLDRVCSLPQVVQAKALAF
jgi:D-3-phosphoglycerate dehydrogenase